MTQKRLNSIRQVLSQRQLDFTVVLDNVHKPHNLSAIIRTCDAVGIAKVHAVVESALRTSGHTASGSDQWVTLQQHADNIGCIQQLQSQGFKVYAAHLSDTAKDFREIDYTQKTALLMGQEKWGVSPEAAEAVDGHIIIPMHGMVESLNVSVATAVILYEMQRQRTLSGHYDQPQFDKDIYDKLVFEWMQPKMARYYRDKGLPYPELDEDGDIIAKPAQP